MDGIMKGSTDIKCMNVSHTVDIFGIFEIPADVSTIVTSERCFGAHDPVNTEMML